MVDFELKEFKLKIDLRSYAAANGYELDRKESWSGSSVMRNATTHDKIIVKREIDGHYVYFSVRDNRDNGSIVDFVQNRQRVSLGAVRKELRPWIGMSPIAVPVFAPLHKSERDRVKVEAAYTRMKKAETHPYLENERALPASILTSERFAGRVRIDDRGNAVFPHFDQSGLSGFRTQKCGVHRFRVGRCKGSVAFS